MLPSLTPLQFGILNGLMDDCEDVEQLYLMLRPEYSLAAIMDGIAVLLRQGFIEIKQSSDERIAPLNPVDYGLIHHYWFSPTSRGQIAWEAFRNCKSI